MHLDGQSVLVTGASQGLGRAIALAMAEVGADLVLAARDRSALQAVAAEVERFGGKALVVRCDVREPEAVIGLGERAIAEFGRVDTLVNSAGIGLRRAVTELTVAEWDDLFNTLVRGMLLVTQAILPSMIARRRGNIINLVAPLDRVELPDFVAYTSAQYAITGLTRTLARELQQHGINVNGLHPGGFANTAMLHAMMDESISSGKGDSFVDPAMITPAAIALAAQPSHGLTGAIVDATAWNTDQGLGAGLG
jgi:3-oxoacyl-[acyl-carrier protein] reductase